MTRGDSRMAEGTGRVESGSNRVGVLLMCCSALTVCLGQLLWKLGAHGNWGLLLVGFVAYGAGAVLMLVAYRFGELSILQPMLGLSYALSLVAGALVLHEHVSVPRIIGVVVVMAGVGLLASGSGRSTP